jgi:hypothetical protein
MISKKTKVLSVIAAALIGFSGVCYAAPRMLRNVMSNCGYRESVCNLKKPSTFLTKGHYSGFVNSFIFPTSGADESTDLNPQNFVPDPLNKFDGPLHKIDLNAIYLGLQENSLPKSSYRPTRLTNSEVADFYSIADFIAKPERLMGEGLGLSEVALEKILNLREGEVVTWNDATDEKIKGYTSMGGEEELVAHDQPRAVEFTNVDLHDYTLSFGRDEQGIYTSIYDVWDFTPNSGYFRVQNNIDSTRTHIAALILPLMGSPIQIYDRLYWKDNGVNVKAPQPISSK